MKNNKLLLVCLSLIMVLVLASCDFGHQCDFGEEWKFDAENHWHECECGLKNEEGAHSFGEWTEGEAERTRVCSVCAYVETAPLEVHQHDYSDKWSKDGENHWHSCSGCNVPADKAAHTYDNACDADCNVCGATRTPEEHKYDNACDGDCNSCGATRTPEDHKYDNACDGECNVCGATRTPDEHKYDNACDGDCNVCGVTRIPEDHKFDNACDGDCNVCGATRTVGDHVYSNCTDVDCDECGATREQGEHIYDNACTDVDCNSCGDVRTAPGHSYDSVVTAPTCEDGGYTTNTCSVCGDTNTSDATEKLGHTEVVDAGVEADCTTTGLTEGSHCSVCGKVFVAQEEIAANGHSYGDELLKDENNHWKACGTCGEKSELIAHTFDSGVIFDGKVICTCECGYTMENIWDGVTVSEGLSGSGTEEDPYLIQSGADLAYIDQNMTAAENFKGVYFKMTRSIDLGNHSMKIGEYPGWGGRKIFSGIFDGNNCSIINLNMTESGKGAGLFSVISGTVKNLTVCGTVKGDDLMTGGIVGWLYNGTLENCVNYVNVTSTASSETGAMIGTCQGGTVINCVNYGSVVGIDSVGGIAGKASGTLTGCVNYGSVKGCTNLGGIYGSVHSSGTPTLTDCVDNGTISAHDLTYHEAKANSCEAAGSVEYYSCSVCGGNYDAEGNKLTTVEIAATGHAWDEGALSEGIITFTCGNCGGTKTENAVYTITVNHLYLDGSVAAEADTFEYGYNEAYTVYAKSIEGYAASHDYVMGTALDNQTVTIYYSELDTWDGTSVSTSLSGSGTEEDPYLIQSGADLAYFAKVINEHNVDGTFTKDHASREVYTVYTGVYFKLTKSIDLNGNLLKIGYSLAWNKYSRFGGTFDGNNCSIRGISITSDDADRNDALFGMAYGGTIKNLSTYGSVYGGGVLNGGVVGYVVSATVENCTSYVNIEGAKETGGIVGNLEKGTVINCVNYGKVICGDTTTAGVIVGKNANGTITNCVSFTELNAE